MKTQNNHPLTRRVQMEPQARYVSKSTTQRQNENLLRMSYDVANFELNVQLYFKSGKKTLKQLTDHELEILSNVSCEAMRQASSLIKSFAGYSAKEGIPFREGVLYDIQIIGGLTLS